MATAKGGFDCDFVEPPPKSLECPICLLTLRDPHVISCCGNHFCCPCIQRIQRDGKPCPLCNDPDFTVFLHKGVMREVNALIVRCPQKELGCQWVGELGKLQQHLSPGAGVKGGGCGYVEVECAYQCGGRFQRHTIREHELEFCPNRPLEVQLSSMTKKLTVALAENHSLKEEIAQVKEKQDQEIGKLAEKLEAALQVIRVEKEDENRALMKKLEQLEQAQDQQKKATTKECQSLARELNQLKQTTANEVAQITSQQQSFAKAAVVDNQLQVIKQDVRALTVKQERGKEALEAKYTVLESQITPVPPFIIDVYNFLSLQKKQSGAHNQPLVWSSDSFYSHPGGYKMRVDIYAGGCGAGKGTHVSLYIRLMRGRNDDSLHWPFHGSVTIQLYNWSSGSWTFTESVFFCDAPTRHTQRPSVDTNANRGWGYEKFISHDELQTQLSPYPDVAKFRVSGVKL